MQNHAGLLVETITGGPFVQNCFVVADEATRHALVVDPGNVAPPILEAVRTMEVQVQALFATHGHIDHVSAAADLVDELDVPFLIHPLDREWLTYIAQQCRAFGLPPHQAPERVEELAGGQVIELGTKRSEVILTPGHSAGGVCLHFAEQGVVFAGDTLFAGSIGRTDLPGGSMETLLTSIRTKLLTMPDETVVYTGHGPATRVDRERTSNPFLGAGARRWY